MPGKDPSRGGVRAFGPDESMALNEQIDSSSSLRGGRASQQGTMWSSFFGSSETTQKYASEITFTINSKSYTVAGSDISADTTLNSYIRDVAHLTGTKFMCYEGGCGACVVAVTAEHPVTKQRDTFAVNSCLVPVLTCGGWEVTTVEGLGDRRTGYHKVQAALAHFNGTQCGFCSPGMVMNMYSLLEGSGKAPSMAEVENSFGGNLCRCTGYRSILDAFKSLSTDATPELKQACADIEDIYKICSKTGSRCSGQCSGQNIPVKISLSDSSTWHRPTNLDELFAIFGQIGDVPYKLVAGNTAEGVYRSQGIMAYIDVRAVAELRATSTSPVFTLGGNVTLTEAMRLFEEAADIPGYHYLRQLAKHIDKIANVPVRNLGTLAGNLSIKRAHPEFPSDIFTTFEAVGATLNIAVGVGSSSNVSLIDYLKLDMKNKIILSITFPLLTENHRFRSFKITPRAQNAHAYVNAGFLVNVDDSNNWRVADKPRIVFGGINSNFIHASGLETFLTGKNLFDASTITSAISELDREVLPDHVLPDASPEFRKKLSQALFYKFLLGLDPSKVSPTLRSGGDDLERPLSSGKQDFDTDKSKWPLNQPIPKIEALAQCSGEAEFVNDIPSTPGELHAAFVLTKKASGTLAKVDSGQALKEPGVVAFFQHTDISGPNSFTPLDFGYKEDDEIFCSGKVKYAGQAVGVVVAETRDAALKGASKVQLEYADDMERPIISINQVLNSAGGRIINVENRTRDSNERKVEQLNLPITADHVIKGVFEIGKQFHLTMETQTCLVVPKEESYDVFSSCQWMDLVQAVVSRTLQIPSSQVNMIVRRLGGGYGAKITRPSQLAAACAIAVKKLNRPVRIVMPLTDNMELAGKRFGLRNEYEVEVDSKGKITRLKATLFEDCGINFNDSPLRGTLKSFLNCYDGESWQVEGKEVRTDTASNTWCRAPGTTEGVALIEEVMENIASTLKLDPLAVRLTNMTTTDNPLPEMISDLKQKADYDSRRTAVDQFNAANRWMKKGISIVPMKYDFHVFGNFPALVSIYQIDGSVAVTHGGIEMGQGMNTKVAQVAAHVLGVPLDKISVKPSNSLCAPNAIVTGGSIGSEAVAFATMMACNELQKRLEPIKASLKDASWVQIVKTAWMQNVDLCASYMYSKKDEVKNYFIYGVAIAEVEVDMLTGEKQVLRVDLLEDVGQSLSPMVDVGQIEGAFVMGMGYWLSEELIHDPTTGRLLNTRTWNYKPPGAKDIPIDFRIYFKKNASNPVGVYQSKATGEPPLNLSIVVYFALKNALDSARKNAEAAEGYYTLKPPATTEQIFLTSLTDPQHFQL